MKNAPKRIKPYEGNEPYIFVSYSHRNEQAALRVLRFLLGRGFRVWYDEGINPGTDWANVIADHIRDCGCFLSLISPEYAESENCQAEINFAIKHKRNSLPVYLAPTDLPSGIDMYLSRFQAVLAYRYEDENEFFEKLLSSHMIEPYRSDAAPTEQTEPKKPRQRRVPRVADVENAENDETTAKKKRTTRAQKAADEETLIDLSSIPWALGDGPMPSPSSRFDELFNDTGITLTPADETEAPPAPARVYDPTADYVSPDLSLLHRAEPLPGDDADEVGETAETILSVLQGGGVKLASIDGYAHGHAVTRYDLTLMSGTRASRVNSLADDLALALGSSGGIRIEVLQDGSDRVSLEVPNRTRHTLYLREVLESDAFNRSVAPLTAALGVDVDGKPIVCDLAKLPHLLVGGTTGSGKTIAINCILTSLICRNTPEELRLILIDPKRVEFSPYRSIPHLLTPVLYSPKNAAHALMAAVEEMNARYDTFSRLGVRNLEHYDDLRASNPSLPKLPRIVIVIDELADLMLAVRNEVETAVCHLAQKARASGIHLILSTQRPSVDVLSGVIRANVPSVLACSVPSLIASRALLDRSGAEKLLGRGDMLFRPVGKTLATRMQGAYVADREIDALCEHLRSENGVASYDEEFMSKLLDLQDPDYLKAVRTVIEFGSASVSLLQRKLQIGFARAANLLDRMQDDGIVSPPNGSKPRTVLLSFGQFLERLLN